MGFTWLKGQMEMAEDEEVISNPSLYRDSWMGEVLCSYYTLNIFSRNRLLISTDTNRNLTTGVYLNFQSLLDLRFRQEQVRMGLSPAGSL